MAKATTKSADDLFGDAMQLMRDAYWAHVRDLAEDIAGMGRDGEFGEGEPAREKMLEYVHETVDGDGWVIYTAKAQAVCLVSDNDGAYADNYGSEGIIDDSGIAWSRLAYAALEADVMGHLDVIDFDVNDPDSWKPTGEE